jgi:hypothetical protein
MIIESNFIPLTITIETKEELNTLKNMCILYDKSMKDSKYAKEEIEAYKTIIKAIMS